MVRQYVRTWFAKAGSDTSQGQKQNADVANIFEICRGYDTMAVKTILVKVLDFSNLQVWLCSDPLASQNRELIHAKDDFGFTALHVACMNTNDEGPEIAQILLQVGSLAARHKDNLGQLPLHIGNCLIFVRISHSPAPYYRRRPVAHPSLYSVDWPFPYARPPPFNPDSSRSSRQRVATPAPSRAAASL